jgi:NAD(P)-dependent dehydrogenase (short-subunit alcohol dehydrogenase family)
MRRALITGASRGIGRAIAAALHGHGFEVIATGRRLDALEVVPSGLRLELDVTSEASVARALTDAGPIDVLINNAGVGVGGPTEDVPIAEVEREFGVNFFGAVRMIKALLPQMRRRRSGTIVNISSLSARVPWPFGGYYGASKAALESLSEALQQEVEPFGIRVIVVEPGVIASSFGERFVSYEGDAAYREIVSAWAGRFARDYPGPEVVAEAVARALEEERPPLRLRVGEDADALLALRGRLDDELFVGELKRFYGIAAKPLGAVPSEGR